MGGVHVGNQSGQPQFRESKGIYGAHASFLPVFLFREEIPSFGGVHRCHRHHGSRPGRHEIGDIRVPCSVFRI